MRQREHDPLDTSAQEAAEAKDADAKRLQRSLEEDDFKWLMQDKRGRRFMWRLLGLTGVFRNPFTGNSETFFRCGEQNIGQKLMAEIHELCPELYQKMVNENVNRKRNAT